MSTGIVGTLSDPRGIMPALALTPANGFVIQAIDIGFPEMRAVVDNRMRANGTRDTTSYFGARALTISIGLAPELAGLTNQKLVDKVRAFMRPSLRPVLTYQMSAGDVVRQVTLRADQSTYADQFVTDEFTVLTCGWRVPNGIIEAATAESYTVTPASLGNRHYPFRYPRAYPVAGTPTPTVVTNSGNEAALPLLRIFGPVKGPVVVNQTTGESFGLTRNGGATVVDGDYIAVDMRERTVKLNSTGVNLFNNVDLPAQWWSLEPGDNSIAMSRSSSSTGVRTEVIFRAVWL